MITIEKDDFTGLRKINTKFYGLKKFIPFDGPNEVTLLYMTDKTGISDVFDLLYLETENGQGNIVMRICSTVDTGKYSVGSLNSEWPRWEDNWPMIIDGERVSLTSSSSSTIESNYELKVYNLPIDTFNKLCNANEIKFSLRGRNNKIEGVFNSQYQTLFKAFEQFCFGDEEEGKKMLKSISSQVSSSNKNIGSQNSSSNENVESEKPEDSTTYSCYSCKANNIVPNSWETFRCHKCSKDNTIIRPKNLTDEERNNHESKVLELIKEKKVEDAIKYYAANFGFTEENAKLKVKEIAEKNGISSIYKKYENTQALHGCLGAIIIALIIMALFKAC